MTDIPTKPGTFQVGDTVRIVCKRPSWHAWTTRMDATVGQFGEVTTVNGNRSAIVGNNFAYPPSALLLVRREGKQNGASSNKAARATRAVCEGIQPDSVVILKTFLLDEEGYCTGPAVYFSALNEWLKTNYNGIVTSAIDDKRKHYHVDAILPYDNADYFVPEIWGTSVPVDVMRKYKRGERRTTNTSFTLAMLRGAEVHAKFQKFFAKAKKYGPLTLYAAAGKLRSGDDVCAADRVFREVDDSLGPMCELWGVTKALGMNTDRAMGATLLDLVATDASSCTALCKQGPLADTAVTVSSYIPNAITVPSYIPNTITTAPTKGKASMLSIKTRTFVNGSDFAYMSDDQVTATLTITQKDLKALKEIEPKTKALNAKIAKIEANIDTLVKMADERFETKGEKLDDDDED